MKISAKINICEFALAPDPWNDQWGPHLRLDHVIVRDLDGTPHTVEEFEWPLTAYSSSRKRIILSFYYWKQRRGISNINPSEITQERLARMRELQFLMTRHLYFADVTAPSTLRRKLATLRAVARFAEERSSTIRDVLTETTLFDSCGERMGDFLLEDWISWVRFLGKLEPESQLGFTIAKATPGKWKDVLRRSMAYDANCRQHPPLPTRIYSTLINNISAELDLVDKHKSQLLGALSEAVAEYRRIRLTGEEVSGKFGASLIEKYGLFSFFERSGYNSIKFPLRSLTRTVSNIFEVCKLQIHLFSGMRDAEAAHLPFHCTVIEQGLHGRTHYLIEGITTKFNRGRRLRTKWVTTECDGFRAIRLAQEFAGVVFSGMGVTPSADDDLKDNFPLFPTTNRFPWMPGVGASGAATVGSGRNISRLKEDDPLLARLCPIIEDADLSELEAIDAFRAWRAETAFQPGRRWHLTTHQFRRSLSLYANSSGLVRLSSLRRQLQHITREMALYYGRGSSFCKNFISDDPHGFERHIAVEWQSGDEEAQVLAFVRDVLDCSEPMFGGAGVFYQRQRERGEVMSRDAVTKKMRAGLLAYREGPLGGCTKPGSCENRKGLNLLDTVCVTNGCKNLIGKHSKIVQVIRLRRNALLRITPGSINEAMEREELESLERIEREWRA